MNSKHNFLIIGLVLVVAAAAVLVSLRIIEMKRTAVQQEVATNAGISPATTSTPPAAPTQIIKYAVPISLPTSSVSGYCWTNSIAAPYRTDAWRCMVGNSIQDPCFTAASGSVFCPENPANNAGLLIKLTKPLPAPESVTSTGNWAWRLELANGVFCEPFTGTRPFIDGQMGTYSCAAGTDNQNLMLMGDLNASSSVWTAEEAVITQSGNNYSISSSSTVPVEIAWQ